MALNPAFGIDYTKLEKELLIKNKYLTKMLDLQITINEQLAKQVSITIKNEKNN